MMRGTREPNGKGTVNATPFRFSTIIPTHNRRDILLGAVASVAAPVRPWPCELIVVVDGSRDGTVEALKELVLPLSIKVIDQPNRGAAAARNAGAAARGRFLFFLDDDMIVEPDMITEHDRTLLAGADAVVGHILIDDRSPVNILTRGVERWADERRSRLELSGGELGVGDFLTGQLSVRVLAYHAIEDIDDQHIARYSVGPGRFEEQIGALRGAGYHFIDGDDLLEHLDGRPLKPNSVLLTFDDAYESLITNAVPVLDRLGIPAVVCTVSDEIGGYNSWDVARGATKLPLLTSEQLGGMRRSGWEIASHTRRHAHLTELRNSELRVDLTESRDAVTRLGLGAPRFLAYPHGEHDRRVRSRVRRTGYAAAFALTTARTHPSRGNRYALPRVEVQKDITAAELVRILENPATLGPRDIVRRELLGMASGVLARVRRPTEHHPDWNPDGAIAMTTPTTGTGIWCCDFDLAGDGTSSMVPPRNEVAMRVLVRLHGEPLGYVTLPRSGDPRDIEHIRAAAWRELGDALVAHLIEEGAEIPEEPERAAWRAPARTRTCPNFVVSDDLVSVVVCTRNRSESLPACLDRLAAVTYPAVEFVIVDNAPSDDSTRVLVEKYAAVDRRFRYVLESRPGLSRARNAGLGAAGGRYLAYTDDDVAVDSQWIHGLVRGFQRRPDVACVTGLVCTAAITNGSEAYFDARLASWSTRCRPQFFDMSMSDQYGVLYPFSAGIFGTGASFAFDRQRLVRLGGFDEALGAGTLTRGGEDLDIFVRILLDGGAIAYEPAAVVWHHHRADEQSLLKQMYGYGTGLTAYLTKLMMHNATRNQLLRRVPAGLMKIAQIRNQTNERLGDTVAAPAGAMRREFTGYLAGPVLYFRARRALHADAREAVGQTVGQAVGP
jgi:glycosyltransferase involved in cell wall biosynthesis